MSLAKLIADLRARQQSDSIVRVETCDDANLLRPLWVMAMHAITPVAQGGGGLLEAYEGMEELLAAGKRDFDLREGQYFEAREELTREREQAKILREQLAIEQSQNASLRAGYVSMQEAWNEGWNACQSSDVKELENQVRLLTQAGDKAQAEKGEAELEVIRLQAEVDALKAERQGVLLSSGYTYVPGGPDKEHCPRRLMGETVPKHMPCDTGDFSRDEPVKGPCTWCKPPGSGKDSCEQTGSCMSCNGTGVRS